ncbi:PQQ-dependent sugar dehydrogenase [Flavihumibacter fluvii]|uniref:PQQ-dependent sugar dehydrogenase n=1 Tax=Flavihumibacter fluvii TaxID=2838157 RepID=UPI001BDF3C32|nr:PQQ-dependent sugar dehydrogenase [Flavihumibacter fluvii]ULQ52205.1 PQQ-dependent sugar dehydrogenase [Flavihumibacter fluvii]
MNKIIYSTMFAATLVFAGCGNNNSTEKTSTTSAPDSAQKAEEAKNKPNTDYKPAFAGQTRIGAVTTSTPYQVDRLNDKIGKPWSINPLPDGRLLITDKSGFISIYSADGALLKKITGLPKVDDGGQGGLLDLAFDPDFAKNNTIYWSFSEKFGQGNLTAVAKGVLSESDSSVKNAMVIFRAKPDLKSEAHYGSRLLFDKDGNLFVSAGERSILDGRKQSQWLNSGLGKVFRITKDGKPAPGNPFIGKADAMPEIYSYGHRNPQGLDIHPVTGDLWEVEFGPRGGDELNLVKAGSNYGWPIITYGIEYDGRKIGDSIQQKEGMEQPVYYWDPVVSPSGILFYTGDAIPEWKNNLFISGLSSLQIIRLVIENNKVVGEEHLLTDQKERIRDVTQYNGTLYAVSDGGILFRIRKK